MTDEEAFVQRLLQADRDIERARRIQPGRGYRYRGPSFDGAILLVIIGSLIMGWICSH